MISAMCCVKSRWLEIVGALAWLWLTGVPSVLAQSNQPYPGEPIAGRRIFVERGCVRCHAIWGNGGNLGPDFALVGAGRSLQQLAGMFWNHTPRMIETVRERGFQWTSFTEAELADIISYIYYVKLFDEPGDPSLGERWYREQRCAACHAVGGEGGNGGPALDGYARYVAPIMLAQGMWNHWASMRARLSVDRVPMPTFLGREMADIQAYVRERSSLRGRDLVFLPPPNPNAGRQLFASKGCSGCHGRDGSGTAFGPDLRSATQRLRVSEIAGALWNHASQMAQVMRARGITFPRFQGTEMADVIAFLYYLRFYEMGGDLRRGELLFTSKGCSTCHAPGGESSVGPDLSQSQAVLTPLGLATAMWDHAPAMYDLAQLQHAEWPLFEGDEMRDLSVYLRSLVTEGRSESGGGK
ncbi:MAG: c-type cytochrome [Gemmatimonadales bacterium]|nr:c-type cytochrome [Gemmatimonadales bacterium]